MIKLVKASDSKEFGEKIGKDINEENAFAIYISNKFVGFVEEIYMDKIELEDKWYPNTKKELKPGKYMDLIGNKYNPINHHFYDKKSEELFIDALVNGLNKNINQIVVGDEEFFTTEILKSINKKYPNKTKLIKEEHCLNLIIYPKQ